MRRFRIFLGESQIIPGHVYDLSITESHHLCHVLRATEGTEVELLDGRGGIYSGELVDARVACAKVVITGQEDLKSTLGYSIWLCPALCKEQSWRMILEKSVELGVRRITPVITEFSVYRDSGFFSERKKERWQQILIGAVKQTGWGYLPDLDDPQQLSGLSYDTSKSPTVDIVVDPRFSDFKLSTLFTKHRDEIFKGRHIRLLIGPEGGFSERELKEIQEAGWEGGSIGIITLRSETAVIASLAVLHTILGEF